MNENGIDLVVDFENTGAVGLGDEGTYSLIVINNPSRLMRLKDDSEASEFVSPGFFVMSKVPRQLDPALAVFYESLSASLQSSMQSATFVNLLVGVLAGGSMSEMFGAISAF